VRLGDCVVGVLAAGMGGTLLSGVDLDVVLQWSDMQRMMDELSETEEDTGSSDENLSASDIMSATGDLSDSLGPLVSRGSSFASESLLSGGLGGESLLSGGMNGIRPLLDSRHLLNAARADAKMSSHISSLLQSRAAGGNLDDSLGGHEELQSFLPPLLFGSRPFPRSQSMGSLYGRPSSPSSRDGEDEDDDGWMRDATPGPGGKARPGATDEKSGSGKTRFVWSAELHARFEQAVAKLGVDRAKPQAISQLMGVEGDNAPTRQNIKSHLQKYRLLVKKRAAQAAEAAANGSGGGSSGGAIGKAGVERRVEKPLRAF
jgi:SHAQKYF class myb-like DNA-binding protein